MVCFCQRRRLYLPSSPWAVQMEMQHCKTRCYEKAPSLQQGDAGPNSQRHPEHYTARCPHQSKLTAARTAQEKEWCRAAQLTAKPALASRSCAQSRAKAQTGCHAASGQGLIGLRARRDRAAHPVCLRTDHMLSTSRRCNEDCTGLLKASAYQLCTAW